jgi:hypothetical protein
MRMRRESSILRWFKLCSEPYMLMENPLLSMGSVSRNCASRNGLTRIRQQALKSTTRPEIGLFKLLDFETFLKSRIVMPYENTVLLQYH